MDKSPRLATMEVVQTYRRTMIISYAHNKITQLLFLYVVSQDFAFHYLNLMTIL